MRYAFGLLAIAIIALTAVWYFDPAYQAQRQNAAFYSAEQQRLNLERQQLDLDRARLQTQLDAQHAPVAAQAWSVTQIALILSLPIALAALAVAAAAFFRKQLKLVRPDVAGRLPAVLASPEYGDLVRAALAGFHQTQYARAVHQPGQTPTSITYSPNLSRAITASVPEQLAPYALPLTDALSGVKSFAELLAAGTIGKGRPILIGYNEEGTSVEVSWQQLYSCGCGGLQGSGKTWTAVNIIAQSVLNNARLVICDLHAGDAESLATRLAPLQRAYLFEVADGPKAIIQAVKRVDERLTQRKGSDNDRSVILLVIDEYTSTIRRLGDASEMVADLIANLTSEGRKYGIFVMLLAQNWSTESTGGSQVRNTLASALIHRTRASEARMLTGMTAADLPGDTLQLTPGQFYLLDTRGDLTKVTAPRIAVDDVAHVAGLLVDNHATLEQLINEPVNGPSMGGQSSPTAAQSQKPLTHQEALVLSLVRQRKGIAEIVKTVWGVDGGSKYKERSAEVMRIIAEQLEVRAA